MLRRKLVPSKVRETVFAVKRGRSAWYATTSTHLFHDQDDPFAPRHFSTTVRHFFAKDARHCTESLVMYLTLGGFVNLIAVLMVHAVLGHELGWSIFNHFRPVPLEAIVTAAYGLACVGAIILGASVAFVLDYLDS